MKKMLKKENLKDASYLALGLSLGYSFFWLISNPKSHVKKKMPSKNFKNFHFSPNLRYVKNEKAYHFHHWIILSSFYIPILLLKRKILPFKIMHGFAIGSIIQGLLFKDRLNVVYNLEN